MLAGCVQYFDFIHMMAYSRFDLYLQKLREVNEHMCGAFHSAYDIKTASDDVVASTTLNKVVGDGQIEVPLCDFNMMLVEL